MSIAIVAPEKFDFQDLVCIELMLRFRKKEGVQFRVEPKNGEDAQLALAEGETQRVIEVQVKGSEAPLTLKELAGFLAHFEDSSSECTLFERLLSDPQRIAVVVASGRCADSTAEFLGGKSWLGETPLRKVSPPHAAEFLTMLTTSLDKERDPSALTQRRQTHLRGMGNRYKAGAIADALRRVVVLERIDEASLTAECERHLREDRIPNDVTLALINRMREIVKGGKRSQEDVLPLVTEAIRDHSPLSLRPNPYVERGDEPHLISKLRDTGVLLLSGSPRIGKTAAARAIAASFETQGYDVREFNDLATAQRFLLDPAGTQRLALLDDPLGGTHPVPAPSQVLHQLRQLVLRLKPGRKLLVAQANDRLLEVSRSRELSQVTIADRRWENLDELPREFLPTLWRRLGELYGVSEPLFSTVLGALESGSLILEAGCMVHLAADQDRISSSSDLERIKRLAREEAADLGRALMGAVSTPILASMAVGTTPGQPMGQTSLAYLTGKGGEGLPGRVQIRGTMTTHASEGPEAQSHPKYDTLPELNSEDLASLEQLELRRIVELTEQSHLAFTHPFYRAAAETLIDGATQRSKTELLNRLQRALFCLSPRTSRAAARNIEWISDRLIPFGASGLAYECAVSGLSSIYPSTRDICFQFLMRHFSALPESLKQDLPKWITEVTFSLSDVHWQDGEAVVPPVDELGMVHLGFDFDDLLQDHDEHSFAVFDEFAPTAVTPEAAWRAVKAYSDYPERLTEHAISRLLSYDEALIRANGAKAWLASARDNDEDILERIFSEEHPAMAVAVFEGILEGWDKCTLNRQDTIFRGLKRIATSPVGAAVLIHKLVVFSRGPHPEEQAPWPIFSELMPIVLELMPHAVAFNDARLYDVVHKASRYISNEATFAICSKWIGIVERIAATRIPSDYALGVTKILTQIQLANPSNREAQIARLIALPGTGARIRVVADLVSSWSELTEPEKSMLRRHLSLSEPDSRWLHAAVITHQKVPLELTRTIVQGNFSLQDGVEALERSLPSALLDAAICVYVGEPDPLGYVGIGYTDKSVWEPLVERIALSPSHELFDIAWNHITFLGKDEHVRDLVLLLAAHEPELAFETLLRTKLRMNGEFMPATWKALLDAAPDTAIRSRWIQRMAMHSTQILDRPSDVTHWLSGEHLTEFTSHLDSETIPLAVLLQAKRTKNMNSIADLRPQALQLFRALFEKSPPVIHGTCSQIQESLDRLGWTDSELSSIIEHRRLELIDQRHAKDPTDRADKIKDWIYS